MMEYVVSFLALHLSKQMIRYPIACSALQRKSMNQHNMFVYIYIYIYIFVYTVKMQRGYGLIWPLLERTFSVYLDTHMPLNCSSI